jgi:hypothetical protein
MSSSEEAIRLGVLQSAENIHFLFGWLVKIVFPPLRAST